MKVWPHKRPIFVCGHFALAERGSLCQRLGLSQPWSSLTDAELVVLAYQFWGPECPNYLDGQFSFAIWEPEKSRLFCCRDHLGTIPFLYWFHDEKFYFSSDLLPVLNTIPFPRELNSAALAAGSGLYWGNYTQGDTFHRGIYSVPPSCSLTVTLSGLHVHQYWRPVIRPELLPKSDAEVFARARALVEKSVAHHLRNDETAAVSLSGGLDSSAIAGVAALHLKKRNRTLLAVTAVNQDGETAIRDERDWADEFRIFDNIVFRRASATGRGPFDHIDDLKYFERTWLVFPRRYLTDALHTAVRDARILLSGGFGENTVSDAGHMFHLECLTRLRWGALAESLSRSSSVSRISGLRLLASEVWGHVKPQGPPVQSLLLAPSFLREQSPVIRRYRQWWPDGQKYALQQATSHLEFDILRSTATPRVQSGTSYPFLDRHLLEYSLAVPSRFKNRDGYRRYLIRRAFEDVLPTRIKWRRDKMAYSPDYRVRYNSQIELARNFVRSIRPSDPVREIVDVSALERGVHVVDPLSRDLVSTIQVPRTIYLINFLRQFPGLRA